MAKNESLRVGVLVGREWSWPSAFLEEVNRRNQSVSADYIKIGGTMMNEPCPYRLIIDRISHEVPYYRSYLKNAVLQGTLVVNDPFMWTAQDSFFGAALATRLGMTIPKTIALPNKDYVPGIDNSESLRNLKYPLDWNTLAEQVGGTPCILKDAHGNTKETYLVHSIGELIWRYNQSGLRTMILQEYIEADQLVRCCCLGQTDVHLMTYQLTKDGQRQYRDDQQLAPEWVERLTQITQTLCQTIGYDMNAIDFALKGATPYVLEFLNPAPDMDVNALGRKNFDWMVAHMADMTIRLAQSDQRTIDRYTWGRPFASKTEAPTTSKQG
jgi:glutathione synthase/RimK-type ligase-like ATP-grasp enzyme